MASAAREPCAGALGPCAIDSTIVRESGLKTVRRRPGLQFLLLVPGLALWNSAIAALDASSRALLDSGHSAAVDIAFHQGMMTLDAARASWTEVLDEFARKAGVRFHYTVAPLGMVTVSCDRMTVARALECLLGRDAAFMVRYRSGSAGLKRDPLPTDVWLLRQPEAGSRSDGVAAPPPWREGGSPRTDRQGAVRIGTAAAGQDDFAALLEMTSSDDPQARMQALGSLAASGKRNDPAVQTAFRAALMDEDANVRAQAVSAMARLAGAEATAILQEALRDRDASVRLMAVDSARADAEGAALLQEALADRDETVRALAATKLGPTGHALESPQQEGRRGTEGVP